MRARLLKAIAVWAAILVPANVNGLLREFALAPLLGAVAARMRRLVDA